VASTFDEEATEPPPSEDANVRRSARGGIRRLPREFDYLDWLNERDASLPLTRDDLRKPADRTAEAAVANGGGIDAIIEATGLCTRENVLAIIHPEIVRRAEQNDAVTSPLDAS
jgi:hypothetical protein